MGQSATDSMGYRLLTAPAAVKPHAARIDLAETFQCSSASRIRSDAEILSPVVLGEDSTEELGSARSSKTGRSCWRL